MDCRTRKLMTAGLLGLSLGLVPLAGQVAAQTTTDRTGVDTGTTTQATERHDNDFNMGWLGLIGLAGLAGLMPRRNNHTTHRTDTTTR
jgi:hypothetical protein